MKLGHVRALDGVRGVAILAVLGDHYFGWPRSGFYGVDLFFVLSGFLITTLLLEEHDRGGRISLRRFYVRRARRLLPALATVAAVIAILTVPGTPILAVEKLAIGGFYMSNFVMAQSHFLFDSPISTWWSLAEEEQFYLLWPLLLILLLPRTRESRLAAGVAAIFAAVALYRIGLFLTGATQQRLYYMPDTHADGLIVGCLLALARRRGVRVPQSLGWLGVTVMIAAMVYSSTSLDRPIYAYGLPVITGGCALFVGASLEPGLLARVTSVRPLAWLGVISYSLYLWHTFAAWFMWKAFGSLLSGWWYRGALTAAAFALATLSYYKVEQRFRGRRRPGLAPAWQFGRQRPALIVQPESRGPTPEAAG